MKTALIFDIKRFAVHDGPGIRTTVFFKGCPMQCWWCHNPESRNPNQQSIRKTLHLDGKEFETSETVGKEYSVEELFHEIQKDKIFFDESRGGVTFSGGEPLFQAEFLYEISKLCKAAGIHTTLDTCGYAFPKSIKTILPNIDLILFDLKHSDPELHLKYTGVLLLEILYNLELMVDNSKKVIIRFPLIPSINDDESVWKKIAGIMKENKLTEVNILPYHSIANEKYRRLEMDNRLPELKEPTDFQVQKVEDYFKMQGFVTKVGG